jgi:hypothetical protein
LSKHDTDISVCCPVTAGFVHTKRANDEDTNLEAYFIIVGHNGEIKDKIKH